MSFVALTQSMATLSLFSAGLGIVILLGLGIAPARRIILEASVGGQALLLWMAFGVALAASAGSLYYSEVVGFVPCGLCWYQRIAMYPIVLILGFGGVRNDFVSATRYALLLAGAGLLIALYHVTIQFLPSLDAGICSGGVSCTGRYLSVFGFVSIPVMAASAFVLIIGLLVTLLLAGSGARAAPPTQPDAASGHGPRNSR